MGREMNKITERWLVRQASKQVEAIELRFGECVVKDGQVNLTRLNEWAWRIAGARQLMRVLLMHMNSTRDKDHAVYNEAIVRLIMESPINMDRFLTQEYEIRYRNHERNKKGKLIHCEAFFAKKQVTYIEVE